MATPPPEAPSVLRDEKPQLPPSPNGDSSSEIGRASVQGSVNDSKPVASTNGAATREEDLRKNASVNGHSSDHPNNAAAASSPPKSPDAESTPKDKPIDASSVSDGKPISTADTLKQPTNGTGTNIDSSKAMPESPSTPQVSSSTPSGAQSSSSDPIAKTQLPHHPSASSEPGKGSSANTVSARPEAQPASVDQEMRDAPVSPTKLSRERDAEPGDEPSAKRTKIETKGLTDYKAPELPTPATDGNLDMGRHGDSPLTKVQHRFLLKAIQSLKRSNDSRFYREPVDPIKMNIPNYPQVITRPMDLGTIEQKLKNNMYQDAQRVVRDFELMVQNALTFNGPDHIVSIEGQRLRSTFDKQMMNLPKSDEVEEKKPKKSASKTSAARREPRASLGQTPTRPTASSPQTTGTTFALGPEGLPVIRRDSTNADGRPKRSIHPPKRDLPYSTKPKKKKFQWELRFCQEVLDELHKQKHYMYAFPFYYPVDPVALNIPTYHSIIKKPMDLSTVSTKLQTGQYENAKDFESDIRQIFKNCYKFNLKGDPIYVAGEKCEEIFDAKWAQKDRYLAAHEPQPEQHSAESSEEESDEDEEGSEDEEDEAINRLEKQIAEMSSQLEAMKKKKKKTPPKKSKSKKDIKKSGVSVAGKKDKKAGVKPSKPEKARYVSYHDKQIISNGISELPDKKMQEALKIIQTNVPSLKGTQETEIELDIDELPNDVLWLLLKFVKKHAPHVVDDDDASSPVAPNTAPPKPKKNKPMSKYEQEAQINMLESNLSRFQGGGTNRSPDPVPSVEANDSSGDSEDDSEESEEE